MDQKQDEVVVLKLKYACKVCVLTYTELQSYCRVLLK